ncbi:sugar transferase [Thermophilibacter provencensis]|uniref:sugar transferase n=1 Tax=Thermophilibacter provencensis TaxID=1852386 RepID=UPI0023542643|nr:sugar transferase [Thermophilibacter provencensis]
MDRNELVMTQCGGYALEQVESVAAGLDPEAARAAERLRTGRWAYRAVKRAFDVCFSACVLVCLSWLFLIVAIAIKLDDPEGPVIFSQARVGRDGREFRMYKFRSMCADAESRLAELAGRNEKDGPVFKMADDPRVTRVGRFLRKTSMAPVIIGTPGDGEPTKSLSHPVNSSLDLHKCERRPEPFLVAQTHYTSFQFLSFAVSGGLNAARGRPLCACGAAPFKDFRAVA